MPYRDEEKNRAAKLAYYHRNAGAVRLKQEERRVQIRRLVNALKESKPCLDCGVSYPYYVMQFDHTGSDKVGSISKMVSSRISWAAIQLEIAKCDLVCANCHAARTWGRQQG